MESSKWICSQCGKENNENFCIYCGTPKNPDAKQLEWFCPKCGRKNNDLFCEQCGTSKPRLSEQSVSGNSESIPDANRVEVISGQQVLTSPAETAISSDKEQSTGSAEWLCPKCGRKNNDLFCEQCGTSKSRLSEQSISGNSESIPDANRVEVISGQQVLTSPAETAISSDKEQSTGSTEWLCPKCGKKNNGLFCEKCGTSKGKLSTIKESIEIYEEQNNDANDLQTNNSTLSLHASQTSSREVNKSNTQTHLIKNTSVVQSEETGNKKAFYSGCIFALIIMICFMGVQIFNHFKEGGITIFQSNSNQTAPSQDVSVAKPSQESVIRDKEQDKNSSQSDTPDPPKIDVTTPASKPVSEPAPANESAPVSSPATPISETSDVAHATNQNQKLAIQSLYNFHRNITEHNLQNAYSFFSPEMQGKMSYDGWVPGFDTTVSSTPSEVKVVSESESRIVLSYYLQAVDNPGGIQNFSGTAVMIKVGDSWKIDDVINKVR